MKLTELRKVSLFTFLLSAFILSSKSRLTVMSDTMLSIPKLTCHASICAICKYSKSLKTKNDLSTKQFVVGVHCTYLSQ